jgi:hypothetical protein
MAQADSVHSTPPTNTPISQIHPVDAPSRRRFLSTAAGIAAGGTVLALATIPPASAAAAPAGSLDPVFSLIEAHRTAQQHTSLYGRVWRPSRSVSAQEKQSVLPRPDVAYARAP